MNNGEWIMVNGDVPYPGALSDAGVWYHRQWEGPIAKAHALADSGSGAAPMPSPYAPRPNVVVEKSFAFAVQVVRWYRQHGRYAEPRPLTQQFVRAATSIGANVAEAQDAQSKADFVAKMAIALKEARESAYWIELMQATDILSPDDGRHLRAACDELLRLLTAILKTARLRR